MQPTWQSRCGSATLYQGYCVKLLRALPDASVDCCITDPPYPEINRDYGRMSEPAWHAMMNDVVPEVRRILKPTGSAVFILQPNSERVGRMRPWLWEFMAKWTREWGMVQDAYWWNIVGLPSAGATNHGLMRGTLKSCVWLGETGCYRDQSSVLWDESFANSQRRLAARLGRQQRPSGHSVDEVACCEAAVRRGGVTPFNVLPIPNSNSVSSGGATGHGAATPSLLADWWLRYICPPGGTVLDPFIGSGTVGLAAIARGCKAIGIEKMPKYFETARGRIEKALASERQLELIA